MKKIVFSVMLGLILINMLTMALSVQPAKAEWTGTVYIQADGSIAPSDAPIQRDGDVYTFTGNINGSIVIERNNTIIHGAGYTLQTPKAYLGMGVELSRRTNVTIQNMNIKGFYCGICIELSSSIIIIENNITNNRHGIYLVSSSNNIISGNNITVNDDGVSVGASLDNNINGNIIANNEKAGIFLSYYSSGNYINGNVIISNHYGIYLQLSSRNYINGNDIVSNYYGVYDEESSYNSISENHITANTYCGIYIFYSSCENSINRNFITNSIVGIDIYDYSLYNSVNENHIANNTIGVGFYNSLSNSISGNYIVDNLIGIYLSQNSSNNSFWHNCFIGNIWQQVYSSFGLLNIWNDGYPSGGNYWSDYTGVDLYSGPYQNEHGSDGIGDTPYVIDANNTDNYPLMGPWTIEGENVTVLLSAEVAITFENVSSSGVSTLNVPSTGPEPSKGFKLAGKYYDIKTTASYSGVIKIRITYDDTDMTKEEEEGLSLMQWNETAQQWMDITTYLDVENDVVYGETTHLSVFAIFTPLLVPPAINATIDIKPDTLNLISEGKWITAYIELPEGYNVSDINVTSIMLNNTIPVDLEVSLEVRDYDNDTIPDLMVKFRRAQVIQFILSNVNKKELFEERFMTVTLTITGKLNDGTPFQGSDTIKIIMPMPDSGDS